MNHQRIAQFLCESAVYLGLDPDSAQSINPAAGERSALIDKPITAATMRECRRLANQSSPAISKAINL